MKWPKKDATDDDWIAAYEAEFRAYSAERRAKARRLLETYGETGDDLFQRATRRQLAALDRLAAEDGR